MDIQDIKNDNLPGDVSLSIDITRSYQEDLVSNIYKIDLSESLLEYNNEFCKYYPASSINDDSRYLAIIYNKYFNPPVNVLEILANNNIEGLNNVVAYSIIKLSKQSGFSFVVIVEHYDIEMNLKKFIEKNGPLSLNFIEEKLIPGLIKILDRCTELGINCGNINPNNIFLLKDDQVVLREFINSYQNYDQLETYLAPELAECMPAGRQTLSTNADIYALGITTFYAITGKQVGENYENIIKYNQDRFEIGSFKLLIERRKISENFRIFFRGVMQDSPATRWKIRNVVDWLLGKFAKTFNYNRMSENTPISFNEQHYNNLKSLSYALYNNWEEAVKFIQEDKLVKWISRIQHQMNISIVENTQELFKNTQIGFPNKNNIERNNKLTKLLSIMDPSGPIRQRGLAFTAVSLPNLTHYLLVKNKKMSAEIAVKAVMDDHCSVGDSRELGNQISANKNILYKEACRFFSPTILAGGLERIVYALNPYSPCLSNVLIDEYVVNLADLLIALEKISTQFPDRINIDRHVMAFIAAKVNLPQADNLKILKDFPKFSENSVIHGLSFLDVIQQHEPKVRIPNLTNIISKKIAEILNESLYNTEFKKQKVDQLNEIAKNGNLNEVVKFLTESSKSFMEDYNGYYKARQEIIFLKRNMSALSNSEKSIENSMMLGQKLTVLSSYMLCFIVTLILIM